MSLHNQPPYMKKYSFYILSQIYWTKENSDKNALMPINNLQKDTKSSDAMIRGDAIKLLTDMCKNLSEISPFIYEIIQGGIHDPNLYVKQVSLISLVKLFENTDIQYQDYEEDIV